MAGWTQLPYTGAGLLTKTVWDELRAAIQERDTAAGTSYAPAEVAGKALASQSILNAYRAAIENLIPKYLKTGGSHPNVTMAYYTKSTMMTDCFGSGVVDWPTRKGSLWSAMTFNDMRTVLNKLEWLQNSAIVSDNEAFYLPNAVSEASAVLAGQAFDASTDNPTVVIAGIDSDIAQQAGTPQGSFRLQGGTYNIPNWVLPGGGRDRQCIVSFALFDAVFAEVILKISWFNAITDAVPDDWTAYLYSGVAVPPETFAGLRSYGSLAGQGVVPGIAATSGRISVDIDTTELTPGVTNYMRVVGKPQLAGMLDDKTWSIDTRNFYASVRTDNMSLFFRPVFTYKAA